MSRTIIHIDMDAFFAAVEQRDFPALKGKPVAVGGGGRRGVVAAASYEAREYGIHSAMPGFKARKLCPSLIFVKPRFEEYKKVSAHIRRIFSRHTHLIEPLSLDEAYLDVSNRLSENQGGVLIARQIKEEIFQETRLTASAGVSYSKFLAKIASDLDKPDGLVYIPFEEADAFIAQLPVEQFHGIGKVTAARMHKMNIFTGADLRKYTLEQLLSWFGKPGKWYYQISRGIDNRSVNPNRIRKSMGAERTFGENVSDLETLQQRLMPIIAKVFNHLHSRDNFGKTLTLKMKSANFQILTRSKTYPHLLSTREKLEKAAFDLLKKHYQEAIPIRLLGVSISNLQHEMPGTGIQLELDFSDYWEEDPTD